MNRKNGLTLFNQLIVTALLFCFTISGLQSQNLSTSPYSRFGIGDMVNRSTGRSQAMGGLSCGLRSGTSLNLLNPASLSGIDSLNFLFEMAGFERVTQFKTTQLQKTVNNLGVSYLALGFPVTKWWKASTGILPMTNVSYSMTATEPNPVMGDVAYNFQGSGGISNFFISSSISPVKYLSLGATFSYLFGPITHTRSLAIAPDSMYFSTRSSQTAIIGDISMSYGAQVNIPVGKEYFLNLGGTFQGRSNLNAESRNLVLSYRETTVDTLLYSENQNNSVILPLGWASGFTFGKKNVFTAGFDYRTQNWSEALFLGTADSMANSREFIAGIEIVPNAFSLTKYLQRVRYRAGFRYAESYLQLRGSQLTDIGITFGAGFPILDRTRRGTQSSLNVILELGKRGTVKNDLIRETFGSLTLQLTLHDYWFYKPKID